MVMPPPIFSDQRYRDLLIAMTSTDDIPPRWQDTPIATLIKAENFGIPVCATGRPELLICTCIEFRYALPIPAMYAYVIRRASGRLIGSEFSIAYVLSRGVKHLVLIGHNDCGMAKISESKDAMVDALSHQGWHRQQAEDFVNYQAGRYKIEDELEALKHEYIRLKRIFRRLEIAPLFVSLADKHLYLPKWFNELCAKDFEREPALVPDEELLYLL